MPGMRRCMGWTIYEERCKNLVEPPKVYCYIHDDQVAVIGVHRYRGRKAFKNKSFKKKAKKR